LLTLIVNSAFSASRPSHVITLWAKIYTFSLIRARAHNNFATSAPTVAATKLEKISCRGGRPSFQRLLTFTLSNKFWIFDCSEPSGDDFAAQSGPARTGAPVNVYIAGVYPVCAACCRFVYFSVITARRDDGGGSAHCVYIICADGICSSATNSPSSHTELFRPHQGSLRSHSIYFKMLIDFQIKLSSAPIVCSAFIDRIIYR
jgi:hypothetical protein